MANGIRKRKVDRAIAKTAQVVSARNVRDAVMDSPLKRLQTICLDARYWAVDLPTWEMILQYSGVDKRKYISDRFDCDDFAVAFKGQVSNRLKVNGVGFICDFSGGHAYNAILAHDGEKLSVLCVEPQNDQFVVTGQHLSTSESYKMEHGFIIF